MIFLRLIILCCGVVASAESTFRHLVTTETGDKLFFVSERPIRGASQPSHDKIFSWDSSNGVQLFAGVERDGYTLHNTNPYLLFHVSTSSDATRTAIGAIEQRQMSCLGCSIRYLTSSTLLSTGANEQRRDGTISLSGSGEWALVLPRFSDPVSGKGILNLATGAFRPLTIGWDEAAFERRCPCGGRAIANDGTAVYFDGANKLRVTGPSHDRLVYQSSFAVFAQVANPIITDDATRIAFQTRTPAQMVIEDVQSGSRTVIDSATPAGFSSDGNSILYIRRAQLYLMDLTTGNERRLTDEPSGVIDAALSGGAQIAFYTTSTGNIFRVSIHSGETDGIISAPVNLALSGDAIGSSYRVLSQVTRIPAGLNLRIGGTPVPLYPIPSGAGWELWTRIPAEFAEGVYPVEWDVPDDLLWDPRIDTTSIALRRLSPAAVPASSGCSAGGSEALAFHDSSAERVTTQSPAVPGERIRVMMSGLGDSLTAIGPVHCQAVEILYDPGYPPVVTPLAVPDISQSPEFSGLYELAFRLPETLQGRFTLQCVVQGQAVSAGIALNQVPGSAPPPCVSTSNETLGAPR